PRFEANAATLNKVVAAAFNQRRKMLRTSLKSVAPDIESRLHSAGIAPTERAERVSLEQFCALARQVDAP
ncbi:MAG: 16S rRNA (adenine(1518)-N(6)/adenine(1519)-N(6))-dimethyltransferase, partial [Pseudomonadota bacterium]